SDIGTAKTVYLTPTEQTGRTASAGNRKAELPDERQQTSVQKDKETTQEAEPIEDVVSNLNDLVRNLQRELRFSVDTKSGDTIIKVVDRETDEVVRQIPSEEIVALRQRLEQSSGGFFDDSA
ncbi:MAG: flagellar protein FlaG, partial [Sedimenticolaceae bacterium]